MTLLNKSASTRIRRYQSMIRTSLIISSLSLLVLVACSRNPEILTGAETGAEGAQCSNTDTCNEGSFCSSEFTCVAQCDSCGMSCSATKDCPTAQHCASNNTCQRECNPQEIDSCKSKSRTCSSDAQCITKNDITISMGGNGGESGSNDDTNKECIEVEVKFEPQIPNVVLLIDQSGSMNSKLSGNSPAWDCQESKKDWRWNVVRNVLLHPDTGVIKPLEDKVRFGLALYSSKNGFGQSKPRQTCPVLTEVDIAIANHQTMLNSFRCSELLSDTPTRESLTQTAAKLYQLDAPGPKVIVLATDGAPDTCECANWDDGGGWRPQCDPNNSDNDVQYLGTTYKANDYEQILVAEEAQRIYEDLGIIVEVINVGKDALKPHLDSVALLGGAVSGASIDGRSPTELTTAFETIIDGVRSCAVDLNGKISSGKEDSGTILLDEDPSEATSWTKLELNHPHGWRVNSPTQVELLGDACETIKSGEHELDISFPCDAFVEEPVK